MASQRKKIPIGTDSSLGVNPFAGLESSGLPASAPSVPVAQKEDVPRKKGVVRLRREVAGRMGKGVVVVYGEALDNQSDAMLEDLLKTLKGRCACGGTRKGKTLEIQGDHRKTLSEYLEGLGYRVVLSGG